MENVFCPRCGERSVVPADSVGRATQCKVCGQEFSMGERVGKTSDSSHQTVKEPSPAWPVSDWINELEDSPVLIPPKRLIGENASGRIRSPTKSSGSRDKAGNPWALFGLLRKKSAALFIATTCLALGGTGAALVVLFYRPDPTINPRSHPMDGGARDAVTSKPSDPKLGGKSGPASSKITLSGGAWLTRKNGSSEIIRGLDVFLLNSKVEKRVLSKSLTFIRDRAVSLSQKWGSEEAQRLYGNALRGQLVAVAGDADNIAKSANRLMGLPANATVEIEQVYALYGRIDNLSERSESWLAGPELERLLRVRDAVKLDLFPSVFPWTIVGSAKTGIDGRYNMSEIDEGDYCLFARYDTDNFFVEWVMKVKGLGTGEAIADLSNDNASIIINKPLR